MSSSIDTENVSFQDGVHIIRTKYIDRIIDYLDTGTLQKDNDEYIDCYS